MMENKIGYPPSYQAELNRNYKKIFIVFAILFSLGIGVVIFREKQLNASHTLTKATIKSYYYQSQGRSAADYRLLYSFSVNEKVYENNVIIPCARIDTSKLGPLVVGRVMDVMYDPADPSNNRLLLRKSDYKRFKMEMPDSLLGLDSFLHCMSK